MKKFIKGKLTTIVEDDDQRIPEYKAAGWKEVAYAGAEKEPTPATELLEKTLKDANASEPKTGGKSRKSRKAGVTDKKVNDAIKANILAAAQGEPIDDGLISKEGK